MKKMITQIPQEVISNIYYIYLHVGRRIPSLKRIALQSMYNTCQKHKEESNLGLGKYFFKIYIYHLVLNIAAYGFESSSNRMLNWAYDYLREDLFDIFERYNSVLTSPSNLTYL